MRKVSSTMLRVGGILSARPKVAMPNQASTRVIHTRVNVSLLVHPSIANDALRAASSQNVREFLRSLANLFQNRYDSGRPQDGIGGAIPTLLTQPYGNPDTPMDDAFVGLLGIPTGRGQGGGGGASWILGRR